MNNESKSLFACKQWVLIIDISYSILHRDDFYKAHWHSFQTLYIPRTIGSPLRTIVLKWLLRKYRTSKLPCTTRKIGYNVKFKSLFFYKPWSYDLIFLITMVPWQPAYTSTNFMRYPIPLRVTSHQHNNRYLVTLSIKANADGKISTSVFVFTGHWDLNLRSHGYQPTLLTTRSHPSGHTI